MSSSDEDIRYVLGDVGPQSTLSSDSDSPMDDEEVQISSNSEQEVSEDSREMESVSSREDEEENYVHKLLKHNLDSALQVPERVRDKIVEMKYVDFALILGKEKGAILRIDEWTSAFLIFGVIYTAKFPQEAFLLFQYGETIRAAQRLSARWYEYDVAFRRKLALSRQDPVLLLWLSFLGELRTLDFTNVMFCRHWFQLDQVNQ